MRLTLLITPEALGATRLQAVLEARGERLAQQGITLSTALGKRNATRLWMAVTDPDHVDMLRAARGFADPSAQELLRNTVRLALEAEVEEHSPRHLVLACSQLCALRSPDEIARLRDLLSPLATEIGIVLHIEEQARLLARLYPAQVFEGRQTGLGPELALAEAASWWDGALALARAPGAPPAGIHLPPHWIDWARLASLWREGFGAASLRLRPHDPELIAGSGAAGEIAEMLGAAGLGRVDPLPSADPPSEEWLRRCRALHPRIARVLAAGKVIPRVLWRRMLGSLAVPGPAVEPGSLAAVSAHFAAGNAALGADRPDLRPALTAPRPLPPWRDRPPADGFSAAGHLSRFLPRIDRATAETRAAAEARAARTPSAKAPPLSPETAAIMPPLARATYAELAGGRFAPHNRLGRVAEDEEGDPYLPAAPRCLAAGTSGNVIVGCMKNEGPYVVEWVAYHRAIGVDGFLIYTNGCEDGTDAILGRLAEMGIVQHRTNDDWKGKSPQQAALNRSLKEPLVRNAEWLIHIDVDEFMNVRTGNGTISDLVAAMPGATNIAMTWRLFGHGGVTAFADEPVIGQFTRCAPAWCPKPHTVWGFKTMFRNLGAYRKMSCHRPNQIVEERRDAVHWFNGSGRPMAESLRDRGWRNGMQDIGYDLIQLNHYALRSAESFLIKRQRGRALHVDRSIGLNYWIRMDWGDATDLTIRRNLPRLRAEMERLMADPELARRHRAAVAWHRERVAALHANPEFEELYRQALGMRLNGLERVAFSLALDLES